MYNVSNEAMAEVLNEKVAKELACILKEKYFYTFEVSFQYVDCAFIYVTVKEFETVIGKDITELVKEASNCYIQDCFDDWYDDNYYQFEDAAIELVDGFLQKIAC